MPKTSVIGRTLQSLYLENLEQKMDQLRSEFTITAEALTRKVGDQMCHDSIEKFQTYLDAPLNDGKPRDVIMLPVACMWIKGYRQIFRTWIGRFLFLGLIDSISALHRCPLGIDNAEYRNARARLLIATNTQGARYAPADTANIDQSFAVLNKHMRALRGEDKRKKSS